MNIPIAFGLVRTQCLLPALHLERFRGCITCINQPASIAFSSTFTNLNTSPKIYRMDKLFFSINSSDDKITNVDIDNMEKEVKASALARLDIKRVKDAILANQEEKSNTSSRGPISSTSSFSIAIAAACFVTFPIYLLLHNPFLCFLAFVGTYFIASRDPIDEGDSRGEEIVGPVARIVGRATLNTIDETKPRVQAIARAVVTGTTEIESLQNKIIELEIENQNLKIWIKQRSYIDEELPKYNLSTLKELARKNGLRIKGTKAQLLLRLLDAGLIDRLIES